MNEEFKLLVGSFISNCGVIEMLINNCIIGFSKDSILSVELTKLVLIKRISLFKKLLKERSNIDEEKVDDLCRDLNELRKNRNKVAHNPIVSNSEDGSHPFIIVVRYADDSDHETEKISKDRISELVEKSNEVLMRIYELIPESRKI